MTITVAADDLDVGELVHENTPQVIQPATPPVQTPLPVLPVTPPRPSQPLPQPTVPQATWVQPPAGYYQNPNKGEHAAAVTIEEQDLLESYTHWALAVVELEPIPKEALSGPDGLEW